MESFIANFFIVIFGILVIGGIFAWVMNYIIEEMQNLATLELGDVLTIFVIFLIAALIALQM